MWVSSSLLQLPMHLSGKVVLSSIQHSTSSLYIPGVQQVPHVSRQEYTLLDVTEDGFVSSPASLCSTKC